MLVDRKPLKFQIDCGAMVNVIPLSHVPQKSLSTITQEDTELKMWNNSIVKTSGRCLVKLTNPVTGKKYRVTFVVVDEPRMPLLGKRAVEHMGLLTINYNNFKNANSVDSHTRPSPLGAPA